MNDILFLKSVDSTNRIAREMGDSGKAHGFSVVAESQTAGRGRLGKEWLSHAGMGLCCTILVRPNLDIEDYPKITLTAGLAVGLALEELCHVGVQLKWPNDIYVGGRKLGGILVETSSLHKGTRHCYALVGIGVNVNTDCATFPIGLQKTATSLFFETRKEYDVLTVFTKIRSQLLELLTQLETVGFEGILDQWRQRDILDGQWMSWVTPAGNVVYGESLGVDDTGILAIRDQTGRRHEVLSGDLRLARRSPEAGEGCKVF
ncbi:MAG: biotin--[acetyl-CoA-carboxylase] ligase [Desulfobulbaceae bacterium]|jgi:BirA family biotin operon repressor/biotin-[acetyl-CoA-carboxylase] ligase|nr:biotin--[acetyl-CoA-carboxylase] ligase [Desulfobulbaceae bacterium]